jgi:hypothetical protein
MGIHSQDTKHAGAWRLHVLASALDHSAECDHANGICKGGSGKIETASLLEAAQSLGVKRSTFYDWLADARRFGILRGQGDTLYMASQEKLSQILLCNSIDAHKAIIPAKLLFKSGWKAAVWAAYLKSNHHHQTGYDNKMKPQYKGDVISSKTLEDVTGVRPRQQRRLNTLVKAKGNIAVTTISGSRETANTLNQSARDHGKDRHYFPFNDPQQTDPAGIKNYRRVIAHTLPARRTVSDKYAQIGARGRRTQIDSAIRKDLRLVIVCHHSDYHARPQQAGILREGFTPYARRYHETPGQIEAAGRQAADAPDREVFVSRHRPHLGVWDAMTGGPK